MNIGLSIQSNKQYVASFGKFTSRKKIEIIESRRNNMNNLDNKRKFENELNDDKINYCKKYEHG